MESRFFRLRTPRSGWWSVTMVNGCVRAVVQNEKRGEVLYLPRPATHALWTALKAGERVDQTDPVPQERVYTGLTVC